MKLLLLILGLVLPVALAIGAFVAVDHHRQVQAERHHQAFLRQLDKTLEWHRGPDNLCDGIWHTLLHGTPPYYMTRAQYREVWTETCIAPENR
jgi:hypothetical protein